jgi:predicted DNA-binding ribbon-helix-helix protein
MPGQVRRTVRVSGRKTSISLEREFWDCLRQIADREAMSPSALIAHIDPEQASNFSSAIRLFVLTDVRAHIDWHRRQSRRQSTARESNARSHGRGGCDPQDVGSAIRGLRPGQR